MAPPSVLIVDDDPGMVETLADVLQAKHYQVATAHSGEAAVAMARSAPCDAVLMDIVMPGLNGVEALKVIRAVAPRTKVILMTAYSRHQLVEEGKAATAMAVMPKPLDLDEVLALLERATRTPGGLQQGTR